MIERQEAERSRIQRWWNGQAGTFQFAYVVLGLMMFVVAYQVVMGPSDRALERATMASSLSSIDDARAAVLGQIREPGSARFDRERAVAGAVCGFVNAKNGFGGYTGPQRYVWVDGMAFVDSRTATFEKRWARYCLASQ